MDMEEMDKGLCLEDRDTEEMIDRDMMDIVLGIVILLGRDQIPEADRTPEAEKDSGKIDRGHQTQLQISRDVLDVSAKLVNKLERLWSRNWRAKTRM